MIDLISMIHYYGFFSLEDAMVAVVLVKHITTDWPFKAWARVEAKLVVLLTANEHITGKFKEADGKAWVHLHQVL